MVHKQAWSIKNYRYVGDVSVIFITCTCIAMHSLFYQLPNSNLFTQHVISLWRDTSSELWTPVHSFTYITFYFKHRLLSASIIYLLIANKYPFPHDTFDPLFSANQWDWQPYCKLGHSILVVLSAGSMLLLAPVVCPAKSQLASTFRSGFFLLLVD
jgi:hypothetical protein